MMTLEERAQQVLEIQRTSPADLIAVLVRLLKEVTRDQRHTCAEHVLSIAEKYPEGNPLRLVSQGFADEAHALAMNAPEPGK